MRKQKQKILFGIVLSIIIGTGWGCSTKKNTAASRAYHNLTSKYNYYFNGKLSYEEALKRAEKTFEYNYTFTLPILMSGQQKVASMVGGDMDRTITKSTDLINLHSIKAKPEKKKGVQSEKDKKFYNQNEFVRYVRQAWLLIGQARTWKGSHDEARMTFEYVLLQFPETPMWYEANVWLARLDMFANDMMGGEERLRAMSTNRKYPKDKHFTHLLESSWAYYYQKQGSTDKAINHLQLALDNAPNKLHKQRYNYILGQLYQKQADITQSNKYFKKVLSLNPNYEMTFNAKVNLASNYTGGKGSGDLIKELKKMARDEKNEDYLDQIYYALGNIEKSKGDMDQAIEYYQLSAQKSTSNNHQKGLSYLILADYFFEKPDYTASQAYYDSAYHALDEEYPNYKELETKTEHLTRLVENLNIVNHEDSLQRVAGMSTKERDILIAELIKRVRDEEERLRQEEQENRDRFAHFQQNQMRGGGRGQDMGGAWYFYNQAQLSKGLAEFNMRWGRRKLEDNWRRMNKRVLADPSLDMAEMASDTTDGPQKVIDNKSREYYLQDLPLNDSLMAISHEIIREAMLNVGKVYEESLKDIPEAVKAYEALGIRYPTSVQALEGYYNLYQIARFNQNSGDMEKYKQTITSRFPASAYALMLSNPNYLLNLEKEESEKEEYYNDTYALFRKGNYVNASRMAQEGIEKFAGTDYEPKFRFIYAQCIGAQGSISRYKVALAEIVELYPNTELSETALGIIQIVEQRELQLTTGYGTESTVMAEGEDEDIPGIDLAKPEGKHLLVVIIPKNSPMNQLRFNLVSFNVDYYIDLNLTVTPREFTDFAGIITVETFNDKEKAMEYYYAIEREEELMAPVKPGDYSFMVISSENYKRFMEDKTIADYINFFRNNYLK